MSGELANLEQILDVIKAEVKRGVDEYKKTRPKFQEEVESLFSLSLDLDKTTAKLVILVMDYAEYPSRAQAIIPSIMSTTKDIQTTQNNYDKTKIFPDLYPYNLRALRRQYEKLKQLWNKKIWILIVQTGLSTKIEHSIWSSLANADQLGFGGAI